MVFTPDRLSILPLIVVAILWLIPGTAVVSIAAEPDSAAAASPSSNLVLMQEMTGTAVTGLLGRMGLQPGDSLALWFPPTAEGWIARTGVVEAASRQGFRSFIVRDSATPGKFRLDCLSVTYAVDYRSADKALMRRITMELAYQVTERPAGRALDAGTLTRTVSDSVEADTVPALESASVPATHGELPHGSVLDRYIEPFVILGASGLAIYLFFHVRS